MKSSFKFFVALCLLLICLLVGCSDDDAVEKVQEEEFLSAQIDGEDFRVDRLVGIVSCKKRLNDYGGINLLIKAESASGELVEISVSNYLGPRNYIFAPDGISKGWMRYGMGIPTGNWLSFAESKQVQTLHPFLQILEDDGNYVKGNFGFRAHNPIDNSVKLVSNGNFNFRIDSELD